MKVINCTKEQLTLEIVLANGTADSINLQPQSRADLPPGATLNPNKRSLYERKRLIKVVEDPAPEPTEEQAPQLDAPVATPSSPSTDSASGDTVSVSETASK